MKNEVLGTKKGRKSVIGGSTSFHRGSGTEVLDLRRSNPYNFPPPSNPPQMNIEMANYN